MKTSKKIAIGLFSLAGGVSAANAALPAAAATAFNGIQSDGLALIDLVWPVVGAIVGAFILIKLFKRGASKI